MTIFLVALLVAAVVIIMILNGPKTNIEDLVRSEGGAIRTVNGMRVALFCDNHDETPGSTKIPYASIGGCALAMQMYKMVQQYNTANPDRHQEEGMLSKTINGIQGFDIALFVVLIAFEFDSLFFTLKDQGLAIPYWMWVPLALLAVWGGYLFYMKAKDRNAPENDSS